MFRFWSKAKDTKSAGADRSSSAASDPYRVISYGGVGSKMLARWVYSGHDKATWRRNHLHTRNPQPFRRTDCTFLYLFGDPRDAVISLFARRMRRHPRHSFTPQADPVSAKHVPAYVIRHLRNIDGISSSIDESWDIDAFARNARVDPFKLEDHFDRWFNANGYLDIIFIRYETLWNNKEAICDLLSIPTTELPEYHEREASWQKQPDAVQTRLCDLYGSFAARLESYPDIFRVDRRRVVSLTKGPKLFEFLPEGRGMMAHLNTLLNTLKRYEDYKIDVFELDDRGFLYGSWGDFFAAPPFDVKVSDRRNKLPNFNSEFVQPRKPIPPGDAKGFKFYRQGSIGKGHILLPPLDRTEANRLVRKYLKLNDRLAASIESELARYGMEQKLSVHIRGPGRKGGGVAWMLWKMGIKGVPFELYFPAIDDYLLKNDVGVFVFSDAADVIEAMRERYGERIDYRRESLLSPEGEPHKSDQISDKTKLGMDVIIESYLMANSRFLIHGNSNVANWTLCLNPDLQSYDVFHRFYEQDRV